MTIIATVIILSHLSTLDQSVVSTCARGVMVIVVGNEHGDMSSNPGRDWLHFTYH